MEAFMEHFSLWVGAFLTLGIFSFLYKDNPWYKLTEAIFVGISAGYWFVVLFWDNFYGKFWVGKGEDHFLWIGAALGFLMLLRLIPKIGWISRWPLAFVVGATSGFWLINYFSSNVMAQVQATMAPLFSTEFGAGFDATVYAAVGALSIETGGLGQLQIAEGRAHFGGGGAGRLLGTYRFGTTVTLLGGLEFGGGAMVRPGTSASEFVINYLPAVPLVLRFHDAAWHYEVETAAVGLFQADNTNPSFGVRGGAGLGFSALRLRSIIPWAGFVLAAEHYFPGGGRPSLQFIRAGVRVGFFWDPE